MAKITFYTHAYNTEKYMQKCIESVLNQTFTDFEYIIVDNGSTDKTKDIIAEYAKKDNRIKTIRYEENRRGFWPELVKGMAKGEYFAMLDSDDWYEPLFAEALLGFAEKEGLDIAVGGTCFNYPASDKVAYRKFDVEVIVDKNTIPVYFGSIYQFFRPVWGKLYKMSIIKDTDFSGYNNALKLGYGADTASCLDCLRLANRIGITDIVLHNYLVHPQSVSYKYNPDRFLSDIFLFRKAESYLSQFGEISKENYYFLYAVYVNAIIDTMNVILKANTDIYEKLCEIENMLKEQLTQQAFIVVNNYDRLVALKKAILELLIKVEKTNQNDNQIIDLVYSNICLLNRKINQFVNKGNLLQYLKNSDFLMSAINLDNSEMLKKAISSLDNKVLSECIWKAIIDIFEKNMLLSWIRDQGFAIQYADILLEVYNNKLSEAMAKIIEVMTNGNEISFEEELLFMCLNVSAMLEDGVIFIHTKKLQTQLFMRQKRFDEAITALNDLFEMCPNDEEVLQLKKWLEEENA